MARAIAFRLGSRQPSIRAGGIAPPR